ncbi:PHD finger family protein, partial [Trifolium pratense]
SSSGTIGVPEPSVSHLFSIYGFLRSFSTQLFLHPFTLDEFVGALNSQVSNTLFDAIHFSLMRVLRDNLETLSAEGSELASHCLRNFGPTVWGLVLRNSEVKKVLNACKRENIYVDPLMAEVFGVRWALQLAIDQGINVFIHYDAANVVRHGKKT